MPAAKAPKSTKASAKKPAAAKAKTSNSPSARKGLPRKARKPALLPMSDGDAGVQAYIPSMEPWEAAIAKRVDAPVVRHVGLVVEMPQVDVSFSAGVEKLRRLNESFEGMLGESGSLGRRT